MVKIIQTFWSSYDEQKPLVNNGGFLCPEIHWMSWAFSCLQLRKFYPDVELHTNQAGKEILIDKLGLPYTKVHLSLENEFMNNLDPKMWAYSKIHTYSIQKEPFLHVDGDVFIWETFDEKLMESQLISQNVEDSLLQIYQHSIDVIKKNANYVPDWLINNPTNFSAYNAGIIGGSDITFFAEYTSLAFDFYAKNIESICELRTLDSNINTIPEQYLFYYLSKKNNKEVNCFSEKKVSVDGDFNDFVDIAAIPNKKQYIHILGQFKKNRNLNDFVNYVLKKEYPEYWHKIVELFKTENVLSPYFKRYLKIEENKLVSIPTQFELNQSLKYNMVKQQCKVLGVDFTSYKNAFQDKRLEGMYRLDEQEYELGKIEGLKPNLNLQPFPFYTSSSTVFDNEKELLNSYVFVNDNHFLKKMDYDWFNIQKRNAVKYKDLNPYKSYLVYYVTAHFYSMNQIVFTDSTLILLEKIKTAPIQVKKLLKLSNLLIPENSSNRESYIELLKNWYSLGLIYFSKSKKDFIPQEPSPIYVEHQNNLKTQIKSCYEWVLNHYNITGYKEKLISKFDKAKKNVSLHDVIKVLEKLNFETKGVKGDMDSLSQIPLPAIAIVKLREYLSLYVVITKVSDTHITIFNAELKEEESYTKDYFATIWDGSMILMLPKEK